MRSSMQQLVKAAFQASRELASKAPKERKVAVLGAAGGIGQPLSLLMKVRIRDRARNGRRAGANAARKSSGDLSHPCCFLHAHSSALCPVCCRR